MRDAMSFWGGDGERTTTAGGVGLAHLLQTVTIGAARPPAATLPEVAGVTVTADVRLDNRNEIRRLLGAQDEADTDEELVLRAYLRWGDDCVARLRGAFAFALWDAPRQRLLCARDHAGFRPFHYWEGAAGFVFATDAEAVLRCAGVPRRPDEDAVVARFVQNAPLLREHSFFEGVRKLPPGELLVVEPGRPTRRRRHWSPERSAAPGPRTADDWAEALRSTLTESTADAVDGDAPVGAHLSGGLDSSVVAVLAQQALERRGRSLARTFSWSPPRDPVSGRAAEYQRLEAVAAALDVPVEFTALDEEDVLTNAARDQALEPNETLIYESAVLASAVRHGIGVLLTGWGGDEVASFNGRGQLAWLARHGRLATLWREAAGPARRTGDPQVVRRALGRIAKQALPPLLPDAVYGALRLGELPMERRLRRRGFDWGSIDRRAPAQRRELRRRVRTRPSPRASQIAQLDAGHLTNRIESWARAGARAGIDHRYPLLDRRVLELALSMPADVWLREGWTRWVFRKAVDPLLPAGIAWSEAKHEPARMDSWLALSAEVGLGEDAGFDQMVRAHRRRQQEVARLLTPRR